MQTGYYAKLKEYRMTGAWPIAISRSVPEWYKGLSLQALSPEWKAVSAFKDTGDKKAFNRHLKKMLKDFNADDILRALGDNWDAAIFLCYEKPGEVGHRRLIAEWPEQKCRNVMVPDFGDNHGKEPR